MALSVLDIFKVGLGPSSSHTMGPMNAACAFVGDLGERGLLDRVQRVGAQLYGSLALTGLGHCTDRAVLLGLEGQPAGGNRAGGDRATLARIRSSGRLLLAGRHEIAFDEPLDLLFHRDQTLPLHTNGMRFTALDGTGQVLHREEFYSIGGGFHRPRRRVRARGDGRAGRGAAASVRVSARVAGGLPRAGPRPLRAGARQRARLPAGRGDHGGTARRVVRDERLHRARLSRGRAAARRAQGAPPRGAAASACWSTPRNTARSTSWTG